MHVVEVFGRIFISSLFIIEAVRKFFSPDEGMMYMSQYGVPEVLFYPSLVFEGGVMIGKIGFRSRIDTLMYNKRFYLFFQRLPLMDGTKTLL